MLLLCDPSLPADGRVEGKGKAVIHSPEDCLLVNGITKQPSALDRQVARVCRLLKRVLDRKNWGHSQPTSSRQSEAMWAAVWVRCAVQTSGSGLGRRKFQRYLEIVYLRLQVEGEVPTVRAPHCGSLEESHRITPTGLTVSLRVFF